MVLGDVVVPEERLPRDHVHIQRVQETNVLGQIGDRMILYLFSQRMIKRDVDAAVAVFNVENHCISARLLPAAN